DAGEEVRLSVGPGEELPAQGFDPGADTFQAPPPDGSGIEVVVSPTSERLQMLTPFPAWDGKDLTDLPVLVKAQGKCTTDHISMAGPWLRYRGHLENISGNVYMGAVNAHGGEVGIGLDVTDGERRPYPEIAKRYHEAGIAWVAIGDENMGEGSSREHAAMEPRFRGARAVIARSFARIHETNLKKQGILPLTFDDPADYGLVGERDLISVNGLADLAPGAPVDVLISHEDGTSTRILTQHTYSHDQVLWFHAGSALNLIRAQTRG
ncbi:MAG: aconitate hydratase, partial [Acidimicrobiales bacterium]|nr:aconitate hydratase [Acidimicrobiales bacterium]